MGEGEDRKYIGQGKGPEEDLVRKRRLFAPFCSKNASFYQDRLGTNIGKVEKWGVFLQESFTEHGLTPVRCYRIM